MSTPSLRDTVVVTGAAGGIGSVTAALFATKGFNVVGLDKLSLEEAEATGISDGQHPAGHTGLYLHKVVDLKDTNAVADALTEVSQSGLIRHAISIAGGAQPKEIGQEDVTRVPASTIEASIEENLTTQFHFAQCALIYLRESGPGSSLTFTSSINATAGIGLHAYSAAKAGLLSLTRTLAVAEGHYGIRVNTVMPGTVVTPMTQREWASRPGHFDTMSASTLLGACAKPEDIAAAFAAIALDLTAVTGQALVVDAGQTARWR